MPLGAGGFDQVGVRAVVQGFGPYMAQMGQMEKKTQGFGSRIASALKMGAVVGVAALGAVGAASLKMGMDFEKALGEVRTLLPEISDEAFGKMRGDILAMSKEMGIATDKAVPALYQAISAGVPKENVMEFLRANAKLAIGGVTDLETAVDLTTTALNAFGLEASETERVSDILFTGVKLGKTTVQELGASLFQVAPAAAAANVPLEQVTAALATLTASGTPTSVAATQIRQAIVELGKEGTKANLAFQDIANVGFRQFMEEGGDMGEAMDMLAKKAEEEGVAVSDLFGSVEAGLGIQVLAGEGFDKFTDSLEATGSATGATDKAFATMEKTVSRKLAKAINYVKVTMTAFGSKVLPVLVKGIEKLGKFLITKFRKPLNDLAKDLDAFVAYLVAMITQTGVAREKFERLSPELRYLAGRAGVLVNDLRTLAGTLFDLGMKLVPVAGFFVKLAAAVGVQVFRDFLTVASTLLNSVIVPLAEKVRDGVAAFADLTGGLEAGKGPMEVVKNILVALVEAWLVLLAAKKVVTLTQNIVRTGKALIDFAILKKHQVQNLTQFIAYTGKRWITDFVAKTQAITQNVVRTGQKWITDFTAKTQEITQRIKVKAPAESVGISIGKVLALNIGKGLLIGLGLAASAVIGTASTILAAAFVAAFAAGFAGAWGVAKLLGKKPEFITSFSELGDTYGVAVSIGFYKALRTFFTKTLPAFFKKTVPFALGFLVGTFVGFFTKAVPRMIYKGLIRPFTKGLPLLGGAIASAFSEHVFPAIVTFFTEIVPDFFTETIPRWAETAAGAAARAFVNVHLWFEGVLRGIGRFLTKDVPSEILSGFPSIRRILMGLVVKTIEMGKWFKDVVIPELDKFFTETMPKAVAGFFTEIIPGIAEGAYGIGKSVVEGILAGIGDLVETLFKPFKVGFEKGLDYFKGFLMIGSPSQLFAGIGRDIVAGLLQGMVAALVGVVTWLSGLPGKLVAAIGDVGTTLWRKGRDIVTGLWNGIQSLNIAYLVRDWGAKVAAKIKAGIGYSYNWGRNIVTGLWSGINSLAYWMWLKAWAFGKSIYNAIKSGLGSLWPFSPSEAGIDIGKGLVAGIQKGVKQALSSLEDATVGVRASVMRPATAGMGEVVPRAQAEVVRETILAPSVPPRPAPATPGGGVDPAALAAAVASALQGVTVMMDGRVVGSLINDRLGDGTFMLSRGG